MDKNIGFVEFVSQKEKKDYIKAIESLEIIKKQQKKLKKIGAYLLVVTKEEKEKIDELLSNK
jgi:hypothetical protein